VGDKGRPTGCDGDTGETLKEILDGYEGVEASNDLCEARALMAAKT
jgi:hypothetical protein